MEKSPICAEILKAGSIEAKTYILWMQFKNILQWKLVCSETLLRNGGTPFIYFCKGKFISIPNLLVVLLSQFCNEGRWCNFTKCYLYSRASTKNKSGFCFVKYLSHLALQNKRQVNNYFSFGIELCSFKEIVSKNLQLLFKIPDVTYMTKHLFSS